MRKRLAKTGGVLLAALVGCFGGVGTPVPVEGGAARAAQASRPALQEQADALMKNVEEMVAHGGMGDAKAIVHHCAEATRYADLLLNQISEIDPRPTDAAASLDEVIRQCRRVSEIGVHADPGQLLNPALKARAAAVSSIKSLRLARSNKG